MNGDSTLLMATATAAGVLHTLLGPDHYVPFVAMAKAGGWSLRKTLAVTALCGLGHVAGSVVIGAVGLALGTALFQLETLDALRGDVAAWLLIGFGTAYAVWAVVQAARDAPHTHTHAHADGTVHSHCHQHDAAHCHVHDARARSELRQTISGRATPWALFLIFVFGPCEVLIPLLMYPAAQAHAGVVAAVVAAFVVATVGTMLLAVAVLSAGVHLVRLPDMHRYGHAAAGLSVAACGAAIRFGL